MPQSCDGIQVTDLCLLSSCYTAVRKCVRKSRSCIIKAWYIVTYVLRIIFFFFFFSIFVLWLICFWPCWVFIAGRGFSLGRPLCCGGKASCCSSFSCCRAQALGAGLSSISLQALGCTGFGSYGPWTIPVGSSLIGNRLDFNLPASRLSLPSDNVMWAFWEPSLGLTHYLSLRDSRLGGGWHRSQKRVSSDSGTWGLKPTSPNSCFFAFQRCPCRQKSWFSGEW